MLPYQSLSSSCQGGTYWWLLWGLLWAVVSVPVVELTWWHAAQANRPWRGGVTGGLWGNWWAVALGDDSERLLQRCSWIVGVWYLPLRLRIPFCWLYTHSSSALLLTVCSSVKVEHPDYYYWGFFSPFWSRTSALRSQHKLDCSVTVALGMFLQARLFILSGMFFKAQMFCYLCSLKMDWSPILLGNQYDFLQLKKHS